MWLAEVMGVGMTLGGHYWYSHQTWVVRANALGRCLHRGPALCQEPGVGHVYPTRLHFLWKWGC